MPPTEWQVSTGDTLAWPTTASTEGIGRILPGMRTDIVLDDKAARRRSVIDTKFNAIVTNGWYREESLRSGYLYQMYAYLRSQEGSGDGYSDDAEKFGPDDAMYIVDYGVHIINMARIADDRLPFEWPPETGAIWKVTRQ